MSRWVWSLSVTNHLWNLLAFICVHQFYAINAHLVWWGPIPHDIMNYCMFLFSLKVQVMLWGCDITCLLAILCVPYLYGFYPARVIFCPVQSIILTNWPVFLRRRLKCWILNFIGLPLGTHTNWAKGMHNTNWINFQVKSAILFVLILLQDRNKIQDTR